MIEKRDFSGRPSFHFEDVRVGRYARISSNVARRFKLQPEGKFIDTPKEKLQEYSCGNVLVSLEWTADGGYSVNSRAADADQLTTDIATFIHKKYRV